jgi:hypothetical protein
MSLKKQMKFLQQCEKNLDKLNFYLDITNSDITCEPCLTIKHYYNWCLKNIFNVDINEVNVIEFFKKMIEKLDYKVIGNMVYEDFRNLILSYYSLGEIYFEKEELQLSKEYFSKVIEVMEEFLKGGNRFQTDEIQCKRGVVFFELLMWARKNLGDMVEVEEALYLYESIIGEEELLYIQKNYCVYRASKELNLRDKANEAARNVIKLLSSYKGINIDAVEYLTREKAYSSAIDISTEEYCKSSITHWINAMNAICTEAEYLDLECTDKVIKFCNMLMEDLKIGEWSTLILSLYKAIRQEKEQLTKVLNYLRNCFNTIDYMHGDFINCAEAIGALNEIYEDIRIRKYKEVFLRDYEFDFTFYLMNATVQNDDYEKTMEAATKLSSIIEVFNTNKELHNYIKKCEEISIEETKKEIYNLEEYPWVFLYNNVKDICTSYGIESKFDIGDFIRTTSKKTIIGINAIQDMHVEETLNNIIGEKIFLQDKDIVFIDNEEIDLKSYIKDNYSCKVITKSNLLRDYNKCIITYDKAIHGKIADKNIIIIDGNKELRDIDVTYVKRILEVSNNTRLVTFINTESIDYKDETVIYNKALLENMLDYKKEIETVNLKDFSNSKELLEAFIGQTPKDIINMKFNDFKNNINETLDRLREDIKFKNGVYKERRHTLKECVTEYINLDDEVKSNYKEFINKIDGDMEFLGKYAEEKISIIIPDLIEKNLGAIDDLEETSALKEKAEKIFSKAIVNWCNKNIYDLMLEQFKVYITKYSKLYGYHQDTIEKINENRDTVISAYGDFRSKVKTLDIIPLEELLKEFLVLHDEFLNSINYEVTVIPSEKFLNTVADGIKVMFMKPEEKAENTRIKIKNQVIENKDNIATVLSNNIIEHLKGLSDKLKKEVKDVFEGTLEDIALDKSVVEQAEMDMTKVHEGFIKKNEELEVLMKFVDVEILKYTKQLDNNVIYNKSKCYKLI